MTRAAHDSRAAGHRALVYRDPGGFVAGVSAFARDGLRNGNHVLAVLTSEKLGWLREELAGDADAIECVDAGAFYKRHGPMFTAVLSHLDRPGAPGPGRVRIIAEQALGRRQPADVRAYMRYEAASNVAYSQRAASVLCPYDATRLSDEMVRHALYTHPLVVEDDEVRPSPLFMDPRSFVRQSARDTAAPPGAAPYRLERPRDIAGARALVQAHAQAAGLPTETIEDLTIAVSEVAANALVHGDAPRSLWSYLEDGHLVCQIRDGGSGPPDPLACYLPPDSRRFGGRGLWIAHQLCDIVEVSSHSTHTNVYLYTRLPGTV